MKENKQEIISFKVNEELAALIRQLPNQSEFIRTAILSALDNTCPLCQGSGTISPQQKQHWDAFLRRHRVVRCEECNAVYIQCEDENS